MVDTHLAKGDLPVTDRSHGELVWSSWQVVVVALLILLPSSDTSIAFLGHKVHFSPELSISQSNLGDCNMHSPAILPLDSFNNSAMMVKPHI